MNIKLLDRNTIGVYFQYDAKHVALVKSLAGAKYQPNGRFWYFGLDGISAANVKQLEAAGFAVDSGVHARLEEFAPLISQNFASKFESSLPLYPFQAETAAFMVSTGSCLNANFVGSGKSITALAVCKYLGAKKILIVAPKSVVGQWGLIEIKKWLPDVDVQIINNNGWTRSNLAEGIPQFMVIGYERLRIDILSGHFPTDWDVIICDEAHRLANVHTKLYKAMKRLSAKNVYALTATPVMNKPDDLFGIINFLRPGVLGSWFQFMNRYVVKDMFGSPTYYKNMDELAVRVKPFIIKKSLEEVGMQLPPYTEEELPVELNSIERKNYDLIKAEMLFDIEPHIINKIENPVMLQAAVVKLGKLFELCDHMQLIGEGNESSKLEVLKEHLENTLVNGNKAIIITRFSRMAQILQKELSQYSPLLIMGATQDRQSILTEFSTNNHQLLIGTEAIGQGLNLQMANILYNYDSAWNPARMEQRAGRIYRNGQEKPVFIYNLVAQKTVETWLQKKLIKKQELSDRLLPKTFVEMKEMLSE